MSRLKRRPSVAIKSSPSVLRPRSFSNHKKSPDWYFSQWMIAVHTRLSSSPKTSSSPKSISPNANANTSTSNSSGTVSGASLRSFFLECGLSGTPQQRIANDVLVLEVMKENNTRTLTRDLLIMVVLKIGKQLYHQGNSLTHDMHNVKRVLVQNHAGIEYQPPIENEQVQDTNTIRDHEEYQSALHEVYQYELAFKKIFTHFQTTITDTNANETKTPRRHVHHRHIHHHQHHFSRMTESQFKAFFTAVSIIPNLVPAETCHQVFHSQHADELTFDQFSGSMARLAMAAFSNTPGKKTQDWLENKTGSEKTDMLVKFMNRRLAKYQENQAQEKEKQQDPKKKQHRRGSSNEPDLRLLKDHTLEHQHNRRTLNLNASMAERFAKDQIEQGHTWLGMEMSSDDASSSSSSDDDGEDINDDEDGNDGNNRNNQEEGGNREDETFRQGEKALRKRRKEEWKEKQEKARSKLLNKRKQIINDEMDPKTQDLILNLMKCVKNMGRDLRTLRQERIMSLILHRWHTWVSHMKFRRMTQQGQAEHSASSMGILSHCADEWKRRMTSNALRIWYRWSQRKEASRLLATRAIRTRVAQIYSSSFVAWRDLVFVDKEEKRILRNFVMRWNNLELHRWFNMWHRQIVHTLRIKKGIRRMLHAFKFRCFNHWQQHTSEMHNARDMANVRGSVHRFNCLNTSIDTWRKWAHRSKIERERVYVMTMRRHHRILQRFIFVWLQSIGKMHITPGKSRSHWDDVFDEMNGNEEMDPITRAMFIMTTRNNQRLRRKYFDALRRVADVTSDETKQAMQVRKIRIFMLRSWRLKELKFVFRGWMYATDRSVQTTRRTKDLIDRIQSRLLLWCFEIWKNQANEQVHNKHVLHSFIMRLKNGAVIKTFNTWKEKSQDSVSNRNKMKSLLFTWKNKTLNNCVRRWKLFTKDSVTIRTNLEGIDRYVLMERVIAAWRFLTRRRTLHRQTGRIILHNSHRRAIR